MERIPEFNFPHFKPEIHNDKAGDQRVGERQPTRRIEEVLTKRQKKLKIQKYKTRLEIRGWVGRSKTRRIVGF